LPSSGSRWNGGAEATRRLVAQKIEQKIVSGEIAVGELLPAEVDLAAQLKVNRSTVREAIRLLEQNGLGR
jgi:DNA-binding GntR family transcriptional regulator